VTTVALVYGALRIAFFWAAVALAVVCLVDWLVRTRRISPFNPIARFFRRTVDPLMLPVERRIVRAGGQPAHAPWWALALVVVGGIIVLSLIQFLVGFTLSASQEMAAGPSGLLRLLVRVTFGVLQIALIVRVIASWIPRISPYSPWTRWAFAITEPILRPLRALIPSIGMIDITPLIAYFVLSLIESGLLGML
jgi:YggT family protein